MVGITGSHVVGHIKQIIMSTLLTVRLHVNMFTAARDRDIMPWRASEDFCQAMKGSDRLNQASGFPIRACRSQWSERQAPIIGPEH